MVPGEGSAWKGGDVGGGAGCRDGFGVVRGFRACSDEVNATVQQDMDLYGTVI